MAAGQGPLLLRALGLAILLFLGFVALAPQQFLDPLLRHDDYPVLLQRADEYYIKTLTEGRWVNWAWLNRPWAGTAAQHYAIYIAAWCVFCACAAITTLGRNAPLIVQAGFAALLALSIPALLISLWFSTLVPGMVILALYALWVLMTGPRAALWAMPVFVPLSLMTHSTQPLLIASVALLAADRRHGFLDLFRTLFVFCSSYILGLLVIFTLNWLEHGVFGIEVAEWRSPNPGTSIEALTENARFMVEWMRYNLTVITFGIPTIGWVFAGTFILLSVIVRDRAGQAFYILASLVLGFAVVAAQGLLSGTPVPPRALGFVWLAFVAVLFLGLWTLARTMPQYRAAIALLVVPWFVLGGGLHHIQMGSLAGWQEETRALATAIPPGEGRIYLAGSPYGLPSARDARIQSPRAIRLRLDQLLDRRVVVCEEDPEACESLSVALDALAPYPETGFATRLGDDTLIRLPVGERASFRF